jgi:plasmid stabilization system protein ParE
MKAYKITYEPLAELDIVDYRTYHHDHPRVVRFIEGMKLRVEKLLKNHPYSGKSVKNRATHRWSYPPFQIHYKIIEAQKEVRILRVYHSSRSPRDIFS